MDFQLLVAKQAVEFPQVLASTLSRRQPCMCVYVTSHCLG